MERATRKSVFVLFLVTAMVPIILFSCVTTPPEIQSAEKPVSFEVAIHSLSSKLFKWIEYDYGNKIYFTNKKINVVIDPFFDANTQAVPFISNQIESFIIKNAKKFENIVVKQLSHKNLETADYVISGAIGQFVYKFDPTQSDNKYYRVFGYIRELEEGKTIKSYDEWIANRYLDMRPMPASKDNPAYQFNVEERKDKRPDELKKALIDKTQDLEIKAFLNDAETAYNAGNYNLALKYYRQAIQKESGRSIEVYGALYMTYIKLNKFRKAESVFAKLIPKSIEQLNRLTIKLMFQVNSVEFLEDPLLKKQYEIWVRKIGEFLRSRPYCIRVVGNSSHTGEVDYNLWISYCRAKRIVEMLNRYYPEIGSQLVAEGRGYNNCIKCTGADDATDAIDRRVEFVLVDCNQIEEIRWRMKERLNSLERNFRSCP